MLTRARKHLSYANVMATVAVFMALGGGAYAITLPNNIKLPKNSVGPKQIKTNGVTGQDALESSFGQVPSAAQADNAAHAANASSAGNASHADSATHADSASSASSADTLGGLSPSDIGLGFFSGRVDNLVTGTGTKGSPPTGVSTPNGDTTLANEDLTLSPNRPIVMRDLDVVLTQSVPCGGICGPSENVTVELDAFIASVLSASLTCSIETGGSSCQAAGPSASVPPGSELRIKIVNSGDAQFAAGTDALFSWRAAAP